MNQGARIALKYSNMNPGDVISYLDMCTQERVNLQRGMNFGLGRDYSVILMSLRPNAPYADRVEDEGRTLIYEGHDAPRTEDTPIPKNIDQPAHTPRGTVTQNGLFYRAAVEFKSGRRQSEFVKVYEKLYRGIWVYNGLFRLVDAWREGSNARKVFKFRLELAENVVLNDASTQTETVLDHGRLIPSDVKLEVWRRDKGRCTICGSADNLHFDHIIPYSKGGSSLVAKNIQLLCARHNIAKRDKIE